MTAPKRILAAALDGIRWLLLAAATAATVCASGIKAAADALRRQR